MKNGKFSAKRLCRSGVVAALYVALTVAFGNLSFLGGLQVRPSEGLCLLPLIFSDAAIALTVGCFLANLFSPFVLFDVTIGVAATLSAALCTRIVGKLVKNLPLKIVVGGIFPVLFNAVAVPFIVLMSGGEATGGIAFAAYIAVAGEVALSQAIWVYAVGTPLIVFLEKHKETLPLFSEKI